MSGTTTRAVELDGAIHRAALEIGVAPGYLRQVIERSGVLTRRSPAPDAAPAEAPESVEPPPMTEPPPGLRGGAFAAVVRRELASRLRRRAGVIGRDEPVSSELLEMAQGLDPEKKVEAAIALDLPTDADLALVHEQLDLLAMMSNDPIPFVLVEVPHG